jgi:exodeoxyribonuclease VII large subunit
MLQQASHRLQLAAARIVPERQRILQNLARTLNAVSPLPTLARGYAIVTDAQSGTAISSVKEVKPKQALITQLSDGQIRSSAEEVNDETLSDK